jgi:hypothetical protein
MKQILSLFFVFAAYFAQAQTSFHKHEVVAGIGFPYSAAHVGYRYHFTERWAARATYYNSAYSLKGGASTHIYTEAIPKVGVQWRTSDRPFHALLMVDAAVPFVSQYYKEENISPSPPQFSEIIIDNSQSAGVGIGVGIGAEWLIKNRVALLLFTQPVFSTMSRQGVITFNGVEKSSYKNQYTWVYGDILAFSVSYRFL